MKVKPITKQEDLDKIISQTKAMKPEYEVCFLPHDFVIDGNSYQVINVPNFPHAISLGRIDTLYAYPIDHGEEVSIDDLIRLPNNAELVQYDFTINTEGRLFEFDNSLGFRIIITIYRNQHQIAKIPFTGLDKLRAAAYACQVIDGFKESPFMFFKRDYLEYATNYEVKYRGRSYRVVSMDRETSNLILNSVEEPIHTVQVFAVDPQITDIVHKPLASNIKISHNEERNEIDVKE